MDKKRQGGDKANSILMVVVIIIMVVVIVFINQTKKQIEKQAQYVVKQNTEEILQAVDACISSATSSIQLTSHLITQTMTDDMLEDADGILESLLGQTPFDFMEYIDRKGMNRTDKGEQFDASDRVYYQEGIAGNSGIWVNFHPRYSKEYLLNFYAPLYYRGEIAGVLTGVLGTDTNILPLLKTNFYGEEMLGLLCDENGQVIAATFGTGDNASLEDMLDSCGVTQEGKKDFYTYFNCDESCVFSLSEAGGKAIVCVSSGKKTGWKIIQIVPPESFRAVMWNNTSGAYLAAALSIILLLGYLVYIRIDTGKKQNELLQKTDRVVQNYEQILKTTAFDTYKGIRRVNLETAQAEYIYFEDCQIKQRDLGDWMIWLEGQRKYIHPDDFERIRELLSIGKLRVLETDVTYKDNYKSASKNQDGYYNTYTSTVSVTYIDGRKTAIITTIDNTAAVISEMERKNLLMSAASIYISMHVLDLKNDCLEALNSAAHINKIVGDRKQNVQATLRETMYKLTDEQYKDAMMEFVDFGTLDERMNGVNTISLEFLGTTSGWCRARFIAVDYDENNKLTRVLWVVENIDAEKRKANHLLYLSETDLMTGIRNRGSGEKKIRELIEQGHEGVFCLLDADKFKLINDRFGHRVGDKVLISIADCLKEAFRNQDIVMRLGGDEFAVFGDGIVEEKEAEALIRNFFDKLEHINIPELGTHKLSVSLGVAFKLKDDGINFDVLYRNADSCTYKSKNVEGNSYFFYEI